MAGHGEQSSVLGRAVLGVVFVSLLLIGAVWSLAMPRFSQPDEGAHVVRAASAVAGEIIGRAVTGDDLESYNQEQARRRTEGFSPLPHPSSLVVVSVPDALASGLVQRACYARRTAVTPADCPGWSSGASRVDSWTWQGRNPPTVHLMMGLATLVDPSAGSVWLMRFMGVGLTAGLLTAAFAALRRLGAAAPLGFLLALSPMVLYLNAGATPNGVETSAGLALFAGLAALWRTSDDRLRHVVGFSAVCLTLARPLGPAMVVAVVAVIMAWGGNPRQILRIGRVWLGVVIAAVVLAVVWLMASGALSGGSNTNQSSGKGIGPVIAESLGDWTLFARQMMGVFDADRAVFVPSALLVGWLVAMVVLAIVVRRSTRQTLVIAAMALGLLFVLPAMMQSLSAEHASGWWRGRYLLPLWVGVPVLLSVGSWRRQLPRGVKTLVRWVIPMLFIAAQVTGLWVALRRFAAGTEAPWWFVGVVRWSPPLPVGLLVAVFTLGVTALAVAASRASVDFPSSAEADDDDETGTTGLPYPVVEPVP